jgi:TonB-linked SusC/RagA family outer membrane protein
MKCSKKKVHLFLWLFLLPAISYAQIAITGTVTDVNNEAIIGASIVEAGTRNSAVTDVNGKFSLTVANNAVLQVSYLGYVAQKIAVGNRTVINVTLAEDTKALDEVVVIGYGTVRKSDLTGSVASVSAKQFKDQPVKNIQDAIQGRMAGVEVTRLSGLLGGSAKIRIRGTTSINKSNDPLYIVDGIVGDLSTLNPSDIQSIEALKDASATAIYGSRGANGVVLVTTRHGQEGAPQITFESDLGFSTMAKKYDLMSAYEYAQALNDTGFGSISGDDLEAYKNGTKGIDWQDIMTQTGISQDYRLSISGGRDKIRYLVSGNVLDQSAITITSKYQSYRLRANLDTEVTPWLNISTNISMAKAKTHNGGIDLQWPFNYSPTMELVDPATGVYNKDPYNVANAPNPYGALMVAGSDDYNYSLNGNINLLFRIIDGLTLSVQAGVNYNDGQGLSFASALRQLGAQSNMANTYSKNLFWQSTNNLTYSKRFGDHQLTATAVWELSKSEGASLHVDGYNLQTESVGYWNIGLTEGYTATNNYAAETMVSGIGRLMYGYKGRYLFTGTFRADGSSKFQGDNKWGYFPSASAAWNVGEEDFMKDQRIFQSLKLRTSAGVTGNQAIGAYSTLGNLTLAYAGYGTTTIYSGYWPSTLATPNVHWENTYQYDVGIDFSVWDRRLNFTVDWFLKQAKDILLQKTIPGYNAGGAFWFNSGEVKNTGWEFSVNAFPVTHKDVTWETTLNASFVRNEVVDLAGDPFILGAGSGLVGPSSIVEPGKPLGSFYVFVSAGFDENGANLYRRADGTTTTAPSSDDKITTGQANPKWTFGWNNMVSWKNWEASFFVSAAIGFDRLNITRFMTASMVGETKFITLRDAYLKGWDKVDNKADALFPSHKNPDNRYYGDATQWLEDASYLKIRNASIAYRIPKQILKFADVRLSISVQNIWTFTKYKGLDPEVYNNFDGMDRGAYPVPRTFTLGIKASF